MKWTRYLILGALSIFVFWIVFGPIGTFLSDNFKQFIETIFAIVFPTPAAVTGFISFILNVISKGVVPVIIILLGFLPQIFLIFLALEVIKLLDLKLQTHILLAFGCTTLAVGSMEKPRIRDMVLISFIPCGAKLPLVLTFASALNLHFLIIFLIYAFCIGVGWIASRFFKLPCKCYNDCSKETQKLSPWLRGVPEGGGVCSGMTNIISNEQISHPSLCKISRVKLILQSTLHNTLQFMKKITGPVIIVAPILYILYEVGFLYHIANFISPLFAPLGFAHPVLIVALLFGFLGKELVLATLITMSTSMPTLSTAAYLSFLVFIILSPPCISAMVAIRAKAGGATAAKIFALTFTVAYVTSFAFFWFLVLF